MASADESADPLADAFPSVPGYRIEAVLGRGATGVVYRATQLAVNRPVALKILRPELVGTKRAVLRLQREARTAARLAHPSIISAIDLGEVGGVWWYAMELVEGQPLSERIEERGQLSEREALRLFSPLCDALQHAFESGVVHRDIKPANILIDVHGRARLVDLGLAYADGDPLLTAPGSTLGTPHFISPEQARDPSSTDTRSDIWSLGATLYHALCGRPPFAHDGQQGSVAEVLSRVLYQRIPDPRQLAPHLSRGISYVIRKCLNRDPARRYQEPDELTRDLERLRERRAPEIRAGALDPVARDEGAWRSPRSLAIAGGTLAIGALLLSVVGARWGLWGSSAAAEGILREAESWPEIEQVGSRFKSGQMRHQSALVELDQMRVPARFEVDLNAVKITIFGDLDRALAELQTGMLDSVTRRLEAHDWSAARALLTDDIQRVLATTTGYSAVSELPAGRRKGTELWLAALSREVEVAFNGAFDEAATILRRQYVDVIRARARQLGQERRWREGLGLIDTPPMRWLESGGADLRGFAPRTVATIEEDISVERNADRKDLRSGWLQVAGDLNRWIEATHESLRRSLEAGDARDVGVGFRDAFEARLARGGIDSAQVPEAWDRRPFRRAEDSATALETREAGLLEDFARRTFASDDALAAELCGRRAYGVALNHWRVRAADPLFAPLAGELALRARECQLLQGLLERAAAGIEQRRGQHFECFVGNILEQGTVRPSVDPLARGFELETRQRRIRMWLVAPTDRSLRSAVALLRGADIEALAGLRDSRSAPSDGLLRALLRFYEGDLAGAQAALPVGLMTGEELLDDLARRIRAARDAASARDQAREGDLADRLRAIKWSFERSQYALNPRRLQTDIQALRDRYGDILTDEVREDLRAIQEAVQLALSGPTIEEALGPFVPGDVVRTAPLGLELRFRFDEERAGSWTRGAWTSPGIGWSLTETLTDDAAFLDPAVGVRLDLADPFDSRDRIVLRLELEPVWSEGTTNTILISLAGIHVAFLDDPSSPRLLAGTGTAAQVLERVRDGDSPGFSGFSGLPRGGTYLIEISANPAFGRLDYVQVNGVALTVRKQYRQPTSASREILVRAMDPVRLLGARLEGRRQK
ncbi:MAG: tRNA A-37 threonylcarbamoyl transferase component Bud32 [Chlamydiales bacterium]|jgi:tRNA A-37 threonylcarbamoyl transferase component Bud32